MRIFGTIIQPPVLTVLHARQHLAFSCSITGELVGHDHAWDGGAAFEQFPEKLLGCGLVPPALDEYIENVPVLVNRRPEIGCLAVDLQKYFIKVPCVSSLRASSTELSGILLAEFLAPLSDSLVRHDDTTCKQEFFDVTKAEGKAMIEPNRVCDDFLRKAKTFVR